MIPGIVIGYGAAALTVAPVNLRIQFETNKDDFALAQKSDLPEEDRVMAMMRIMLACVHRNDPSATMAQLMDAVDTADLPQLFSAILTKSGFQPRPLGVTPTSDPLNLGNSSAGLSLTPDGSPTTS